MTLGDYGKVVNAQNVTLTLAASGEVITLYNCRLTDESIIDRRNPRDGPIDTPSFSLIEIAAECVLSEDLYLHWRAMRQLTTRGALPTEAFTLVATNIGVGADDWTESGTYILRRMEDIAQEAGRYEVSVIMRIQGDLSIS